ncbi:GNAT family N-acetyltransferase [Algibacter sp.]|uniref:GNAT family N-acetyltransferase n=1 Tax=Algibacter sp. TaxID=1872428 RepID=UPI00341FCCD6
MESCVFNGDNLETTLHLGIFINDNLIGICSFFKNTHPNIKEIPQYQLRGMAVLKAFQGKGLGKIILKHGEAALKTKNVKKIWCNAREIAVPFYKKNNYEIGSKPFNIKEIGTHYMMHKTLFYNTL